MFDQFTVFTPQGRVLYEYNCLGKRFAESQINAFVAQLIKSPTKGSSTTRKFQSLKVYNEEKVSSNCFDAMFHRTRQPDLMFVITYQSGSIEHTKEAEETLSAATALWESLELNSLIQDKSMTRGSRNEFNCIDIISDLDAVLEKYDTFLKTKYEEAIKSDIRIKARKSLPESNNQHTGKESKKRKAKRGSAVTGSEIASKDKDYLDFSSTNETSGTQNNVGQPIDKESFGQRTKSGDFLIKEIDDLIQSHNNSKGQISRPDNGYVKSTFGFFQKHLLGNKTIDEQDLKKVLTKFKQSLIKKNVAPDAADFLTKQVSQDLIGTKTASWTSVEDTARESLTRALTQLLTPSVSVDLLHEIQRKTSDKASALTWSPYIFSVVGVNGVGKSTNLSKLAFWLLQNDLRVLIVACDTFRSGAVEQLRVHVENLAHLMDDSHVSGTKNKRGKSGNDFVELFEAGYGGSDLVAKIAKQAIKYAKDNEFDIVLMDTAGRRHNDPTLMAPLKSFAEQAKPDKIIMVGEALVGTDSVQQARNFNNIFGKERDLDFFIISKCDTVGDMLGTMVNMVYATGIPILFVGVGQTYTDLRTLSIKWAVDSLIT